MWGGNGGERRVKQRSVGALPVLREREWLGQDENCKI